MCSCHRFQIAHPCEIQAAKEACKEAQQSALPTGASGVIIAPKVVTDGQYFGAFSPEIFHNNDGSVLLMPCCYIYRPGLVGGGLVSVVKKGFGAEYWMKLVPPSEVSVEGSNEGPDSLTSFATSFNQHIFDKAQSMACERSVERYKQRGTQVEFAEECSSGDFTRDWPPEDAEISYSTDHLLRKTVIVVRSLLTPTAICLQSISLARAMEFLIVDSLRSESIDPYGYTSPPKEPEEPEEPPIMTQRESCSS